MSYEKRFPDWEQRVMKAAKNNLSASAAAASLGIKFDTFKRYAIKYNCYNPNPSGKGMTKKGNAIPLIEILSGKHPQYQSNKLRLRLLKEEIFKHECDSCKLRKWLNKPIPLELEHKDGNSSNHELENLRLLCPNCHAQTDTYRGKNKGCLS